MPPLPPGSGARFEIIAALDPFHQWEEWADLRSQLGPRVTTTVTEDASHAMFPEQDAAAAGAVLGYLKTRSDRAQAQDT